MPKSIKFVRRDLRLLEEKLADPSVKAKKRVDIMRIRRITVASDCRAIVSRKDVPLDEKQKLWAERVAKHLNWVEDTKATALDVLEEPYDEAELLKLQASEFSRHRPSDGEWNEFQARSILIREQIDELAATTPSKIVEMYEKAEKLEDSITCFAIEQFAPRAVEKVQSNPGMSQSDRNRYGAALRELETTINKSSPEREALVLKAKSIQSDLESAKQILNGYILPSEEEAIRERFHMSGDRTPSLFWECGLGYVQQEYLLDQVDSDVAWDREVIVVDPVTTTSMQEKVESKVHKLQTSPRE